MTCQCGHSEREHQYSRTTLTRRCMHTDEAHGQYCACERYRPLAALPPSLAAIRERVLGGAS